MTDAVETIRINEGINPKDMEAAMAVAEAVRKDVEEAENEESVPPENPQAKSEATQCLRCGHDPGRPNIPLETDKREYVRAVLGGRRFSKTYSMLEDMFQVTLSTLDGRDNELLTRQIVSLSEITDVLTYNSMAVKYRILYSLRSIAIMDELTEYPAPPTLEELPLGDHGKLDALFAERIGHLDQGIVQMISQCMALFRALEVELIQGAFDSNFWKSAGPC